MESLFSLEMHVECVEDIQVTCRLPAVSFRLLDFPTLIIHHVSPTMAERLRQKVLIEAGDLTDLKDRNGNFQFQKGKSCLFKADIEVLHNQLQATPLYVMLLDLWPKKPKLTASGGIEMKTAIDAIYRQVKAAGVAVPSFYKEFGNFKLFNLMGSAVARVKLGYRLVSLGGSLIPHVPTAVRHVGELDKGEQSQDVTSNMAEELGIEGKLSAVEVDSDETVTPEQRDTHTQTRPLRPPRSKTRLPVPKQGEEKQELIITNTVCPPPLYFNALSAPEAKSGSRAHTQEQENQVDDINDYSEDDADSLYYDPGLSHGQGHHTSVSVQTEPVARLQKSLKLEGNGLQNFVTLMESVGVSKYPVLNALFQELSCITTAQNGNIAETRSPVDRETGFSKNQGETRRPTSTPNPTLQKQLTTKKGGSKASFSKNSSVIGLPKQRVRFRPSSLTYKTTRTQQMRLEQMQKRQTGRTRLCATTKQNSEEASGTERAPKEMQTRDLGRTYKKDLDLMQIITQSKNKEAVDEMAQSLQEAKESTESQMASQGDTSPAGSIVNTSCQRQNSLEIFLPVAEGESDNSECEEEVTHPPPDSTFGHTGIPDLDTVPAGTDSLPVVTKLEDFSDTTSWHERQSASVHSSLKSSISDNVSRQSSSSEKSSQLRPPVSKSPQKISRSCRPKSADSLVQKVSFSDAYPRGTRSSSDLFTSGEILWHGNKQPQSSSGSFVEENGSVKNESYSDDFNLGSEAEQSDSQNSDSHRD